MAVLTLAGSPAGHWPRDSWAPILGPAMVDNLPLTFEERAIEKEDDLLEGYIGISDIELGTTMVEFGEYKGNITNWLRPWMSGW